MFKLANTDGGMHVGTCIGTTTSNVPEEAELHCAFTVELSEGSIEIAGITAYAGTVTLSVVGGTGKYAKASGQAIASGPAPGGGPTSNLLEIMLN